MTDATSQWEELLSLAVAKQGNEGVVLNDLLAAFHRGFPLERLRVLLDHNDPDVVRRGAWILSELGRRAKPLLSYLAALLRHPLRWVRIYAVDAVLTCASTDDAELIVATMNLVNDADEGVRAKAVDFLVKAPEPLLRAGADVLGAEASETRRALNTLLDGSPGEIHELVRDSVGGLRRIGIAAAQRRRNVVVLEEARASADEETRRFAAWALEDIQRAPP